MSRRTPLWLLLVWGGAVEELEEGTQQEWRRKEGRKGVKSEEGRGGDGQRWKWIQSERRDEEEQDDIGGKVEDEGGVKKTPSQT